MKRKLDINRWARKEHFNFFKNFEEPFFGFTVEIDCKFAYQHCKMNGYSFFLFYLHKALVAINKIEVFRYRLADNEVYIYDKINGASTVNRSNGTFGFCYFDFLEEYLKFEKNAKTEIEKTRKSSVLLPENAAENVVHFSAVPWINFTSVSHARNFAFRESCPKITFGKLSENKKMPVSIHAHHALVDGIHVGEFIKEFQRLMNKS